MYKLQLFDEVIDDGTFEAMTGHYENKETEFFQDMILDLYNNSENQQCFVKARDALNCLFKRAMNYQIEGNHRAFLEQIYSMISSTPNVPDQNALRRLVSDIYVLSKKDLG